MQNVTNSMNISVYVDGNDIMFLFKDVTEEQKKQLLSLGNEICNAGVNMFTTLAPRESVSMPAPAVEKMQPVMESKTEVPVEKAEPVEAAVKSETTEGALDIYAMTPQEAAMFLTKNFENGVFVGYDNLIRAYFVAIGGTKESVEPNLMTADAKVMFEKNKSELMKIVNKNKSKSAFEA